MVSEEITGSEEFPPVLFLSIATKAYWRERGGCVCVRVHLEQAGQIVLQELLESLVELQAYKLSPARGGGLFGGLGWRHGAAALAGLVDAGTIVIYMSEGRVKEPTQRRHTTHNNSVHLHLIPFPVMS